MVSESRGRERGVGSSGRGGVEFAHWQRVSDSGNTTRPASITRMIPEGFSRGGQESAEQVPGTNKPPDEITGEIADAASGCTRSQHGIVKSIHGLVPSPRLLLSA